MPLKFPSPSSQTFAIRSSHAANSCNSRVSDSNLAIASRAERPGPLSATPGPVKRPSGNTEISSGRDGEKTVSRCAEITTARSGFSAPNHAKTFPARSSVVVQRSSASWPRNHAARCCSKNVGAAIRQSCKCLSLIQARSRTNQR